MFIVFYFMIFIIVFIISCYIRSLGSSTYNKPSNNFILYPTFVKALKTQNFSNVSTVFSNSYLNIIRADADGENYIFGIKKNSSFFNINDISQLYNFAQKNHIHTVILVTSVPISNTSSIYPKIKEYNIEIWDFNKVLALANESSTSTSTHNYSILKTSDTSNDTCKIDTNSYNPIQEDSVKTHSIFSGLFDKPEHL